MMAKFNEKNYKETFSWKTKNNGPLSPLYKGIVKRAKRDMRIYIHVLSKSINKELFPSLFCFLCSYACVEGLDFLTTTTAKMFFSSSQMCFRRIYEL